ncbi:NUDIX domain-containing protein [Oscillospiraceae bacterium LTW-04]|nr:NUDIX hydrolase [Oscillospiraceae bacterium MB24-C1]
MAEEKQLSSQRIYDGRILSLRVDRILLENGREAVREVIDHQGAAGIVAFDEQGKLLMVRQYRYPVGQELLELPAGKIDPGETPLQCAMRELQEETGYKAEKLTLLGRVYPAAAYDVEMVHLYYAEGLTPVQQQLDEDEILSVEHVDFDEAVRMVIDDEILDSKTQIGILKIKNMR